MSKKNPIQLISTDEIRAVYARGESAVIELVTGLLEQMGKQEARLTELEGMEGQLLPSARTCEILSDLVGANISEGTLFNTRNQCFEQG